jgi:hypothetical protein
MADLVNDTGKRNLSVKNQEPTHLSMASHDDLGGTTIDAQPNGVKIDASKGVKGRDTTVKGSGQLSEPSHLKAAGQDELDTDPVEVNFGSEEDVKTDKIDEALDAFEEVEIEVGGGDDDDEDDKDKKDEVKEEASAESEGNTNPTPKEKAEAEAAMNSGPNKETGNNAVNEEDESELPPWLQKKSEKKDDLKEDEEIVIKSGGDDKDKKDDGEKKENPFAKKDDGEKKENPFAKKDEVKSESVKVRVDLPKSNLFESVGLTKAAQKKVGTLFESAIKDVTIQVSKQLHKHYKSLHESKVTALRESMAKQMDQYLDYVVEEWMKTNRVAVRKSLRTQMAEEFLDGLHKLFKEHYIDIPDSKVDVVKALTEQVTGLKKSLNEEHTKKMQLRDLAHAANKARIVSDFVRESKMSEAQALKFVKLAEGVSYTKAKDFREKLGVLRESYITADGKGKKTLTEQHLPEEAVVVEETAKGTKSSGDPDIDAIASAISRQAKTEKEWQ